VKATGIHDYSEKIGVEFLPLFLSTGLDKGVTDEDLVELRRIVDTRKIPRSDSPPDLFKSGMAYFFLATAQIKTALSGHPIDVQEMNGNWRSAIDLLNRSYVGAPIANSLSQTQKKRDRNGDFMWSIDELQSLLH
jgi:hypothetical protein